MLSMTILGIAFFMRVVGLIWYDQVITIPSYQEHSISNWIQLSGAFLFYVACTITIRNNTYPGNLSKLIPAGFAIFVLLITLRVSYVVSLHNTKNTLTVFLVGIIMVSLFLVLEYREIAIATSFITLAFIISIVISQLSLQDKIMNLFASIVLGIALIISSRYNYYFKSQHFVRLKQIEEKHQEIERLNIQKGEILSFVAHDLRNPLNNIEALSSLMLLEDDQNEKAEMIGAATKQAKTIINDLLETVKVENQLETEKIELNVYLSKILEKWDTNMPDRLVLKGTKKPVLVDINPSRLERVIDNLISNAIKFSPTHKVVNITLINYETHICIHVKDQGIGIPSHLQTYLFDQFSAAGRKGLSGESTVGLGLHISKKIVEQHHGRLTFESVENKGTTFTILLPLH